jgi:hypothetical protein
MRPKLLVYEAYGRSEQVCILEERAGVKLLVYEALSY